MSSPEELVVDRRSGRVHQAGADQDDTAFIATIRTTAEADLYFFAKAILKRSYLTPTYHRAMAAFIQQRPPQRKADFEPRGHGKTSLGSQALPLHCFVQPAKTNCYWPGLPGVETRLVLVGETEAMAGRNLRVIRGDCEGNTLLRALWPHVVWPDAKRAKKWNDTELILPRGAAEYPEPSLRALGVGAATAGMHPHGLIKDDLIAEKAANSVIEMEAARDWNRASRALINKADCLEWMFATLWSLGDLYQTDTMQDPTVECRVMGIVDADGLPVWPERYCLTDDEATAWNATHIEAEWKIAIAQLKRDSGVYFPLFYLNQPYDPTLTDFQAADLRAYRIDGETVSFAADPRDATLRDRQAALPADDAPPPVERRLAPDDYDRLATRTAYLRRKWV